MPPVKRTVKKEKEKQPTAQEQRNAFIRSYYNHCRFCNGFFRIRFIEDDVCPDCRSGHNENGEEVY